MIVGLIGEETKTERIILDTGMNINAANSDLYKRAGLLALPTRVKVNALQLVDEAQEVKASSKYPK